LADNYPKPAEPNVCGDKAGIKYSFESVLSSENIELYTYIYGLNNQTIQLKNQTIQLDTSVDSDNEELSGNTLSTIFDDIREKKLCISSTSQTMDVFWNEYIQQDEEQ